MKKKACKKKDCGDCGCGSMQYDKNSQIYRDAKAGKKIEKKRIKTSSDFTAALAGILDS